MSVDLLDLEKKITWGALMYPSFANEVSELIQSVDANELISIDKISDETYRNYMKSIHIDLLSIKSCHGSTSKYLKQHLLDSGSIKKDRDLTQGQTLCYRSGIPRLLLLFQEYPDLKNELPTFLTTLLEEGSVDLSSMEDEDLQNDLSAFLLSLGFNSDIDEDHLYSFPEDTMKSESIQECLKLIIDLFIFGQSYCDFNSNAFSKKSQALNNNDNNDNDNDNSSGDQNKERKRKKSKREKKEKKSKKHKKHKKDNDTKKSMDNNNNDDNDDNNESDSEQSHSSSDKSNNDNNNNSGNNNSSSNHGNKSSGIPVQQKIVAGPQLPNKAYKLHQKVGNFSVDYIMNDSDDDQNDEDFGPILSTSSVCLPPNSSVSLSGVWTGQESHTISSSSSSGAVSAYAALIQNDNSANNTLEIQQSGIGVGNGQYLGGNLSTQSRTHDTADNINVNKDTILVREEWMMDIGENKSLTGTFGTARKFQAGKQAKKAAQAFIDSKSKYKELINASTEFNTKSSDLKEDDQEGRGMSLMELHIQNRAEKQSNKSHSHSHSHSSSSSHDQERRPFDREKDVLSHKKMSSKQVEQLTVHAKELSSRFDRGNFQRSF